jgi:RNA polymerase sigma-70 factor (ECF subfamily)
VTSGPELAARFLGAGASAKSVDADALAAVLADALASARAAWPELAVDPGAFVDYIAARVDGGAPPPAAVRALCAADLYLACACVHGDPRGFAALDPLVVAAARFAVARLAAPAVFTDEIAQELRTKLLVGPPARLSTYGGHGALASWLDVAALRAAISALRARGREVTADDAAFVAPAAGGPELEPVRREHATALREAFAESLAALETDARNLLRLYYLDGVGLERLGIIYKVHPSTISRRLAAAREQVLDGTRRRLRDRLAIPGAEVDSLIAALRSQVDVSVSALLAATVTAA